MIRLHHIVWLLLLLLLVVGRGPVYAQNNALPVLTRELSLQPTTSGTLTTLTNKSTGGGLIINTLPTTTNLNDEKVLLINGSNEVTQITLTNLFGGTVWRLDGNAATDPLTDFLGTTDAQPLIIKTNNTERMRVLSGGNTGIGTTTPAAQLHVLAANKEGIGAIIQASSVLPSVTGPPLGPIAPPGGGNANLLEFRSPANGVLSYFTWAGALVFNPYGTASGETNELLFKELASNGTNYIGFKAADAISTDVVWTLPSADGSANQALTTNGSSVLGWSTVLTPTTGWSTTGNSGTNPTNNFIGTTDSQDFVVKTANSERVRMKSTGQVGIGTDNPAALLDVAGTFRSSGTVTLTSVATGAAADDVLLINSSNQVTKTTRAELVAGSGWALTGNDIATSSGALGVAPSGSWIGTKSTSTAKDLRIATNGVTRMIIASDGAITMGGTLGVTGATNINTIGSGVTNIGTSSSTGAVSIGNTGNATTLGSIATTLKTSVGSNDRIVLANSSGTLDQASISSVVAAGIFPHRYVGSLITIGDQANGSSALYNAALGVDALDALTTGTENTAVGYGALTSNTTGSENTAIGNESMRFNSTGNKNTAVGDWTLADLTTGSYNIALGYNAGLGAAWATDNYRLYIGAVETETFIYGNMETRRLIINRGPNSTDGLTTANGPALQVNTYYSANKGLVVRGAASQSQNLLELQTSAGAALFTASSTGALTLNPYGTSAGNTNELRFAELAANGSNYIGFKAPDALASNLIYTLPTTAPTADQVLSSAADGTMSWVTRLTASTGWTLTGNNTSDAWNGTTGARLGTTSAQPLVIVTNGLRRMQIGTDYNVFLGVNTDGNPQGGLGIGVTSPGTALHVRGTIRLETNGGGKHIQLRTPGNADAETTYDLPASAPTTNGQVLSSTTAGVMSWVTALTSTSGWSLTGNTGTDASTNFLGTIDSVDVVLRHFNTERFRLTRHGIRVVQNGTPRASQWAGSFQNIGGPTYLELINSNAATNGGGMFMGMSGTGSIGDTASIWNWQAGPLAFYTSTNNRSGTVRLFIDKDGDVGIGSHIPSARLHVRGGNVLIDTVGTTSGQLQFRNPQGTASTSIRAGFQTSDIEYWLPTAGPTVNGQVLTSNTNGVMQWADMTSQAWALTGNSGTSASTNFIGTTDANDVVFKRDNTERARVTNAGLRVLQNGTPRSSVWTLSVQNITGSAGSTVIEFLNSTAAVDGGGAFVGLRGTGAVGDTLSMWNHQGGPITFLTGTANRSNLTRMRIEPNGNVGIGTNTASTLLDVDGGITLRPGATENITADNQAVTIGNRSHVVVSSNGTPANRTVTLSNGLQAGQLLFIMVSGTAAANGIEIADDPAGSNTNLAGLAQLVDGAVLQLIWDGTDWREVTRSNN